MENTNTKIDKTFFEELEESFSKSEMITILEITRLVLGDVPTFDKLANEMDTIDRDLIELYEKVKNLME